MAIPIIDLFAGPGGLNEGFSCIQDPRGNRVFQSVLSVECEPSAHRTLELRALFRRLQDEGVTGEYYRYLRGEIGRDKLFESHSLLGKAARTEALLATLGESDAVNAEIEGKIDAALTAAGGGDCVLIGGPPCQAYSIVGRARQKHNKKFKNDDRHFLYREYLRIVRRFRPAVFLMENVPGLLSARNQGEKMFELICNDLRGAGYALHPVNPVDEAKLDGDDPRRFVVRADEFEVPQCRSRVFVLGLRSDMGLKPASLVRATGEAVTVADVLKDLPRIRSRLSKGVDCVENWRAAIVQLGKYQFDHLDDRFRKALFDRLAIIPRSYTLGRRAMQRTKGGPRRLANWFIDPELDLVVNHNSRSHMSSDLMRYFYWSQYAEFYGRSPTLSDVPHFLRPDHENVSGDATDLPFSDRFRVQIDSQPSTTVVSHIAKDGHYYIHYEPKQCRSLSVREAARLQTFPDNYLFEGGSTDQYRQVGNAVPPYLAKQIATVVLSILKGASAAKAKNETARPSANVRAPVFAAT